MIWVFIAAAILSAAFAPPAPVQQEPPADEQVRIGEVANPDNVLDASADEGYYKKTKYGWIFWPDGTTDGSKPPKAELAAFVSGEMTESVVGLLIIASPFVLIVMGKRRKRKKANERDMKRISGVSQAEFQFLIRKLSGMEQILHNLMPEDRKNKNGGKKRWI